MVRNRVEKLVLDIVLSYADDDGGEDLNSDSILDVDDLALLWHFWFGRIGEESLTMRASLWRRPHEEVEDGLPDGRHGRLWRRPSDSFFSVPLL